MILAPNGILIDCCLSLLFFFVCGEFRLWFFFSRSISILFSPSVWLNCVQFMPTFNELLNSSEAISLLNSFRWHLIRCRSFCRNIFFFYFYISLTKYSHTHWDTHICVRAHFVRQNSKKKSTSTKRVPYFVRCKRSHFQTSCCLIRIIWLLLLLLLFFCFLFLWFNAFKIK